MKKGFIYSKQQSLFGQREVVGFGASHFCVREINRKDANKIIIENHYSGKVYSASYIHLGVYALDGLLIGVLQFGYAMNPASMSSVVKDTKIDEYLELNRMWFRNDEHKNCKSKAMSYSIKYIKRKYPKIKWIQSFADERCNKYGIVYQACNFVYCGEHTSTFWELDGETFHNSIKTSEKAGPMGYRLLNDPANSDRVRKYDLRQFRYLYFIKRNTMKDLLLPIQEPPKHYGVAAV